MNSLIFLTTLNCLIGVLPVLHTLCLSYNKLQTYDDICHLLQCTQLSVLDLSYNHLEGPDVLEVNQNSIYTRPRPTRVQLWQLSVLNVYSLHYIEFDVSAQSSHLWPCMSSVSIYVFVKVHCQVHSLWVCIICNVVCVVMLNK